MSSANLRMHFKKKESTADSFFFLVAGEKYGKSAKIARYCVFLIDSFMKLGYNVFGLIRD
ncbi:hypothetical protein CE91St36_13620 [Christensenellaceae bacterium]|nr:hypothetical protein CE91St36_13620 [Christensenellaceae bacterium]BDF61213.1 hypothetical protein CE91St37_13630 [Christensenellaceae bacterium]